jgi:thiamine-phosphate pyrophosphorylase
MNRAVYRIIDANFNRSREALRVMEEFCRFVLNAKPLSGRAKQIRHSLCRAVSRLDSKKLLTCRESDSDVGSGLQVQKQMKRASLEDCFLAAAKRASEALRALAETSQIIDGEIAAEFERLRFEVYTLEKDVAAAAFASERFAGVRLYVLVTVEKGDTDASVLQLASECAQGGADCIQLRCKGLDDLRAFQLAGKFVKICKDAGVLSIINDRADIAIAAGADGVHLGLDDLPIKQVRRLGTSPLIVGLTTHSVDELKKAIAAGADYVSIGPVFSSETKPSLTPAGISYVTEAVKILEDTGAGHVAIGGINIDNMEAVIVAGAKAIAVCSAVTQAANPAEACRAAAKFLKG